MELFSPHVQFCPSEHSSSAQAANNRCGAMDQHDTDLLFLHAPPSVRTHFYLYQGDQPPLKFGGGDGGGIQLLPTHLALLVRLHDMDPHRLGTRERREKITVVPKHSLLEVFR
jgi:hypothetical protein